VSGQEAPAPAAERPRIGIEYGVRFGPSFTSLTSVEPFDPAVVAAAPEPTLNFGGFVTLDVPGPVSLQPEVLFAARGQRIHPRGAQSIVTGTGVKPPQADRVILIRYLEFPLLLRVSRRRSDRASLYLVAGPSFGLRRNAVIRQVSDSGKHEEISDEVTSSTLSLVAGAGFQHGLWLVDARITRGMKNIAVPVTQNTAGAGPGASLVPGVAGVQDVAVAQGSAASGVPVAQGFSPASSVVKAHAFTVLMGVRF
jgi:hypothetical protein